MNRHKALFFLLFVSVILLALQGSSGCANIIPPTGGPRDSIPPHLVMAIPRDSTRHFVAKNNKIIFYFDEYVDVKDITQTLIVSPVPKVSPIVDHKLRMVTVRLKDTLQPNTTYSLDFGNAIRDVNEGNIFRNFTYVFSTGNYLDSMRYSGRVLIAASGAIDTTLIVMLHRSQDDSAVVKERPRYYTRVDSTGHFRFQFIAPGTYALYAMKDEGGSRRYLSKAQLFAFADSPVVVGPQYTPASLYAYTEKEETKKGKGSTGAGGKGLAKPGSGKGDKDKENDKDKRLTFQTSLSNNELDALGTLDLIFASPLKTFDSSLVRLTDDNFHDINNYHILRDTTNTKFTLAYTWPTDNKYHLILAKEFASDSAGKMLPKIDTISFSTKKETEYGAVRLRFRNLDLGRNPVLLFVSGENVKFSHVFTGKDNNEFRVRLFLPGDYELRILYDDNKNGVWDPGEFIGKHRQPERVQPVAKKFTVKANWDNEKDYTL